LAAGKHITRERTKAKLVRPFALFLFWRGNNMGQMHHNMKKRNNKIV
jgi:hypothetical protein